MSRGPLRDRMEIGHRISALGIFFCVSHLVFALWVYSQHYEGSWGYVLMAVVDFPVMLPLAVINHFFRLSLGWPLIFILGSFWWYFLGVGLTRIFRKRG
jgi:hypothetical protein